MAMQIAETVPAAHDSSITCLAFDQAHGIVYVGAEHPDIKVWSLKGSKKAPIATLKAHKGHLSSLVFCDGLNVLISGAVDGLIIVWDERGKVVQVRAPVATTRLPRAQCLRQRPLCVNRCEQTHGACVRRQGHSAVTVWLHMD